MVYLEALLYQEVIRIYLSFFILPLPEVLLFIELSASSSHLANNGFNLHMFLNDKFKASKREMVVCEKSLPYILPMARPTSP